MQSRKDLAEAGRRKLEEFRKAKQQASKQQDGKSNAPTIAAVSDALPAPLLHQLKSADVKQDFPAVPEVITSVHNATTRTHNFHHGTPASPQHLPQNSPSFSPRTTVRVITDGAIPFLSSSSTTHENGSHATNGFHAGPHAASGTHTEHAASPMWAAQSTDQLSPALAAWQPHAQGENSATRIDMAGPSHASSTGVQGAAYEAVPQGHAGSLSQPVAQPARPSPSHSPEQTSHATPEETGSVLHEPAAGRTVLQEITSAVMPPGTHLWNGAIPSYGHAADLNGDIGTTMSAVTSTSAAPAWGTSTVPAATGLLPTSEATPPSASSDAWAAAHAGLTAMPHATIHGNAGTSAARQLAGSGMSPGASSSSEVTSQHQQVDDSCTIVPNGSNWHIAEASGGANLSSMHIPAGANTTQPNLQSSVERAEQAAAGQQETVGGSADTAAVLTGTNEEHNARGDGRAANGSIMELHAAPAGNSMQSYAQATVQDQSLSQSLPVSDVLHSQSTAEYQYGQAPQLHPQPPVQQDEPWQQHGAPRAGGGRFAWLFGTPGNAKPSAAAGSQAGPHSTELGSQAPPAAQSHVLQEGAGASHSWRQDELERSGDAAYHYSLQQRKDLGVDSDQPEAASAVVDPLALSTRESAWSPAVGYERLAGAAAADAGHARSEWEPLPPAQQGSGGSAGVWGNAIDKSSVPGLASNLPASPAAREHAVEHISMHPMINTAGHILASAENRNSYISNGNYSLPTSSAHGIGNGGIAEGMAVMGSDGALGFRSKLVTAMDRNLSFSPSWLRNETTVQPPFTAELSSAHADSTHSMHPVIPSSNMPTAPTPSWLKQPAASTAELSNAAGMPGVSASPSLASAHDDPYQLGANGNEAAESKFEAASYVADKPARPEASFLESYLDNLLRLDDHSSSAKPQEQQQQPEGVSGEGPEHGQEQTANSSRRASSSGGAVPASAADVQDDVNSKAALFKDLHEQGQPLSVGREASEASLGGFGNSRFGLPPRVPGHKRVESGESFGSGFARSAGERAQFTLLQQHIDELTEEKLGLQRGMAKQLRVAEELAQENQALAEQYNAQAQHVEALNKKIQRYEDELEAQVLALEGLASEREGARVVAQEAAQRASTLAAEVVSLEQALLAQKSATLRAQAQGADGGAAVAKLEKKVAKLQQELAEERAELEKRTLERRNLVVRCKQLEASLERAEEKGHVPAPPVPAMVPQPAPSVDQQVQCDLLPAPASGSPAPPAPGGTAAAYVLQHDRSAGGSRRTSEAGPMPAAVAVGDAAHEQVPSLEASLAVVTAQTGNEADHALSEERTDEGMAPSRDEPSVVLAEHALLRLGSLPPPGPADTLAMLSRWLPAGPISGASPVAAIAEEEVRLVGSVHELLEQYEAAFQELLKELEEARADSIAANMAMEELRAAVQLHQQQTPSKHLEAGGAAAADVPVPPEAAVKEHSMNQWLHQTALDDSQLPYQGRAVAHDVPQQQQQQQQQHAPRSTPVMLTPREMQRNVSRKSSDRNDGPLHSMQGTHLPELDQRRNHQQYHQQQQYFTSPAKPDEVQYAAAVMTPQHMQPQYMSLPGLPSAASPTAQQPRRQQGSWLGFLFRGGATARPKKRVRDALI